MAYSNYTVVTLAAQIRGELDADADAAGGTAPDRLTRIVRDCGVELWTSYDWIFRRKQGALTTVASTATVDMPADFAEMDQRRLCDNEDGAGVLNFTQNAGLWQRYADRYEADDTADPVLALIVRDTGESAWRWHAKLTPTPEDAHSYDYWYLTVAPWVYDGASADALADSAEPVWPPTFNEGWRLLAKYRSQQAFERTDTWRETRGEFRSWLNQQKSENDETIRTPNETIEDGYRDFQNIHSFGWEDDRWL
uniref:Uncharacterized protein n=1 Tax=viral metagenome TaxID=1070528 RepID=A0A6H1ZH31_9ZZZZ